MHLLKELLKLKDVKGYVAVVCPSKHKDEIINSYSDYFYSGRKNYFHYNNESFEIVFINFDSPSMALVFRKSDFNAIKYLTKKHPMIDPIITIQTVLHLNNNVIFN